MDPLSGCGPVSYTHLDVYKRQAQCCTEAIRRGVKKVFIIDGRVPHAVLIELLTDEGLGTMFEE